MEQFIRSSLLFGETGMNRLKTSKVIVFGVGGVGSYCVEALARSGIGQLILVDHDTVCVTNINRQLEALLSTVGRVKVEVAKDRIMDINPLCEVKIHQTFVTAENISEFITPDIDYIIDAIDSVGSKVAIIEEAVKKKIPIISSMGMANRLDPTKIRIADISETKDCPLARVMRSELRKKGILQGVKTVYSTEPPRKINKENADTTLGSAAFVPSVGGLFIASEVINTLIQI